MKFLLEVRLPHEPFNAAVRDGSAGAKIKRILEELKPESVWFTEHQGRRGGFMIINLTDASQIPAFAEPWFLTFQADVEFHPVMSPDDLARAGLDKLGTRWK